MIAMQCAFATPYLMFHYSYGFGLKFDGTFFLNRRFNSVTLLHAKHNNR